MRHNASILAIATACVVACVMAILLYTRSKPPSESASLNSSTWIVDASGFIPRTDVPRFNDYLSLIRAESDIDIRLVFDRPPIGIEINASAAEWVERLGIGRGTRGQRGLLLYFDLDTRRLKVEVGYGLEAYFPDVYVAFLVDRHAPLFFDAGDRSLGLRLLLSLLHARIRDAALGGDFDPAPYTYSPARPLSGGAGSTIDLRDASRAKLPSSHSARDYAAGATPSETYAAYLKLVSASDWEPEADLFTAESRQYLKQFQLSRAYKDFILLGEYGKSWKLETRGDLALLYFTDTPFVSPHFFIRQGGVWRVDLAAEIRNTKERVGGPLTWSYEGSDDPHTAAFADLLTVVQGYRRFAAGDNRPIRALTARHR